MANNDQQAKVDLDKQLKILHDWIAHAEADESERSTVEDAFRRISEEIEIQTWGLNKTNDSIKVLYKELEAKNKELELFNQRKSDFVANVSHEVRNPLATIKGALYLLQKEIGDKTTPKQKQLMEMGERTIDRLNRLVSDLLDISKIETGKMKLNWDRVELTLLIEEVLIPYDGELAKKNMTIEKNVPSDLGVVVSDRDKLSQVIINLLNNAIKYTPEGGTVAVSAIGSEREVRCEISDNGPGIPEDECKKIFDKFERVTAEKQEGTGLGLAIAKDIVALHKGKIWVESEMGKGSSFIFTLPRD